MLYYLGKGTELKKEECKEYKTIEGALRAAAKDEELVVWDENGQVIGSLTDNVPEGALQTNPDGSVPAFDGDGNPVGTVDAATVAAVTGNASQSDENGDGQANGQVAPENGQNGANPASDDDENKQQGDDGQNPPQGNADASQGDENGDGQSAPENGQNEANSASEEENEVIIPQGKMKVTVICDGSLNLRRSPAWGNENICGRATRGQSYFVKEIHKVNGKKMVRTVGDVYLSGESEHVQFEQV